MASATKSIPFVVSPQAVPQIEPESVEDHESAEFGDVSAETREILEADFFQSLRGGAS